MESPQKEKPKTGKHESHESVDEVLEHMLREGKEIGSGKDGIVFKVDLANLEEGERHLLAEGHVITPDEEVEAMAAKILKVYSPELGDYEFRMQKRAQEILSGTQNVVRVPETMTVRDQHISEETRDRLNGHGAALQDRAEIIMMDYIEGQDLGNMMYDFVLRQEGYEDDYISDLSYSQKEQSVGQALGFEHPDLESVGTPEEKASAQAVTFERNEEKLLKYLKKRNFQLDPIIFEKLENSIRLLHRNGFYHNDLHKRNVMIGRDGEVYLIDFGRAGHEKRKDGIEDTLFSKRWKRLSVSEEDEQRQRNEEKLAQARRIQEQLQSHPRQQERVNAFVQAVATSGTQALERELAVSQGDDSKFEQFLIMLCIAREAEGIDRRMIDEFIVSLEANDRKLRPFEKNKVRDLQQIGYL